MRPLKPAGSPRTHLEDPLAESKRAKKRIQNRNAQRSYREKQAAYIRALEKMVNEVGRGGENLGSGTGSGAGEAKSQAIWMDEIRELQEALLRMRRRFQSLSLAAASNADDAIFQKILTQQASPRSETPQIESPSSATICQQPTSLDSLDLVMDGALDSTSATFIDWEVETDVACLISDKYRHDCEIVPSSSSYTRSDSHLPGVYPSNAVSSPLRLPSLLPSESKIIETLQVDDVFNSTDILGVERTIKKVLKQPNGMIDLERSISLAVRIMLKRSALLEGFFSIMGGTEAVEKIIQWRITPTPANRDRIPHPFRPTVLQQHFKDHHHCIDFLFWAELRDQALLQNDMDMRQLADDCLRHLVHDVPQLNVALPLVETYAYLVQLAQTSTEQRLCSPIERVLDLTDSEDGMQSLHPHFKVFHAVKKYQLDTLSGRRLSPRFAEKYPSLDVTNIVTRLPVATFG